MSQDEIATQHALKLLEALALTPERDQELVLTPARLTSLYKELFWGMETPPPKMSVFSAQESSSEPVILAALPFRSMCVHHLLPFFGAIDVAYEPNEHLVGFGSIGRVIDYFAARPQMQERLVKQVSDYLIEQLKPKGLLVRCRARQLCMEYRGATKYGELISLSSYGTLEQGPRRGEVISAFTAAQKPL